MAAWSAGRDQRVNKPNAKSAFAVSVVFAARRISLGRVGAADRTQLAVTKPEYEAKYQQQFEQPKQASAHQEPASCVNGLAGAAAARSRRSISSNRLSIQATLPSSAARTGFTAGSVRAAASTRKAVDTSAGSTNWSVDNAPGLIRRVNTASLRNGETTARRLTESQPLRATS